MELGCSSALGYFILLSIMFTKVQYAVGQSGAIQSALIVVPPQFDEIQVLTMADVLRRAEISVTLAEFPNTTFEVRGEHGLQIVTDSPIPVTNYNNLTDMIIIPSGYETYQFMSSRSDLEALLKAYASAKKYVVGMGTGVGVLANFGIYAGSQVTAYPSVESVAASRYQLVKENIVMDGSLFTVRSSVNALEFALKVVERGRGVILSREIASDLYSQKRLHLGVRGFGMKSVTVHVSLLATALLMQMAGQN